MSIFSTILAPLIVLGVGAVVFYIADRFLRPQDKGQVETLVIILATIFLLPGLAHLNKNIRLAPWSELALYADKSTWILALILLIGALALSLACWNRPVDGRTGRLVALSSALLLVLSADQTLVVIAWALADVALLYVLGRRHAEGEQLARAGFLSLLGAMLLAVGLILKSSTEQMVFKTAAAVLLPWAFVLRLLPFPLPGWHAAIEGLPTQASRSSRVLAYLLPSVMALALGQKLGAWDMPLFNGSQQFWFTLWAALIMVIGGIRAWAAQTPAQLIDNTIWYGMGVILCTWTLQLDPAVQLAAGVNAILSVLILHLTWSQCQYLNLADSRTWWHALPVALALGTQAGLPLTLGFPVRIAMYTALFGPMWPALLLIMVAEALLFGALLRILLDLEQVSEPAAEQTPESENHIPTLEFRVSEVWVQRLAAFPRIARPIDALLEKIIVRWLPALRRPFAKIEPAYAAGALVSILLFVVGLFPNLLSQTRAFSGLFHWLSIPRLPEWAAIFLPVVSGIVAYRRQVVIIELVQGWWPLFEHILGLNWLYRAVQKGLNQLRGVLWGGTLVVEGAGYMAWVVLICLVILIFVISR